MTSSLLTEVAAAVADVRVSGPGFLELTVAPDAVWRRADVAATLEPHRLCTYLYDTARAFTDFYEACPVLTAPEPERGNRLALCRLTAATLREGLALLGIAAPERM